jgi:C-terminal processing protease CtpA/Prc
MTRLFRYLAAAGLTVMLLLPGAALLAQDQPPPAAIEDEEGGPVVIDGVMNYTNPLLTLGVAQPLIVLEDQAGFIDRDRGFLFPRESQVLGVIEGDFFDPPFNWSLSLPIEPQGTLRDVDQDGVEDPGVMTFAVAYWSNIFGDPFLEKRDQGGGGWSTAFATTRVDTTGSGNNEVIGGQYVVWAPDDQQGFPSGFGADGLLFTADDPIVTLPAGYTIVDMDSDPFTFSRPARPEMELYEPDTFALDDFSDLDYVEGFDAMLDKMSKEYAFTEYKGIDWEAIRTEFRPRFEEAEANNDSLAYRLALRDFVRMIPDGHVGGNFMSEGFREATSGGLGIAIRELDDGSIIVNYLTADGPAAAAGVELGATILEMNGLPAAEYVGQTEAAYRSPFSTEHVKRLQQLRYASRAPLGAEVTLTFQNPGATAPETATLTAANETESFLFSSFNAGRSGIELPVEYEILDSGVGYAQIFSFSDNELLSVQLWERLLRTLNEQGVTSLIIDMRQNGGGSGFLADQMSAYFFDEELELGNQGFYDEETGAFLFDPNTVDRFYPPEDESLRFGGDIAVIVGPNCASACEFFSHNLTQENRAQIVGAYPTSGLGGSIGVFLMPDFELIQFTVGRAVDMDGEIHIEGKGVAPTVRVPTTAETLFYEGDILLDTAVATLIGAPLPFGAEAGVETAPADAPATEAPAAAETPAAAEETPVAVEETPAAPEETPAAVEETPVAVEETPAAPEETPAAVEETPVAEATPAAEDTQTTPAPDASQPAEAATPAAVSTAAFAVGDQVRVAVAGPRAFVFATPAGGLSGAVRNGATYTVLELSADGLWARIDSSPTGAWIKVEFLQKTE